jgi:hypothetical protein
MHICNESFRNYVFIAHNASGYDAQFIAEACYRHGVAPKLVVRNMRILQLTIEKFNITFIDSLLYVSGSLDSLSKTFNLSGSKGYFPHLFNSPANYEYRGKCPTASHFFSFSDSQSVLEQKKTFCDTLVNTNYIWDFKKEIMAYCDMDVRLLCEAMTIFIKQALDLQVILHKKFNPEKEDMSLLSPFSPPFLTISGFLFGIWRKLVLCRYDIYSMKDEKGLTAVKVSRIEQEVVLFKQWLHKDQPILSSFTSVKNPRFGKIVPDW